MGLVGEPPAAQAAAQAASPTFANVAITLAAPAGSHHVGASLNGVALGDLVWQGSDLYAAALALPPGVLQPGENRLALALVAPPAPGAPTTPVLVDRFAVTYRLPQPLPLPLDVGGSPEPSPGSPLIFHTEPGPWQAEFHAADGPITVLNIGDPLRPVVLAPNCAGPPCVWGASGAEPGRFAAVAPGARLPVTSLAADTPSQWRTPAHGADYILIAPRSLWPAAQRLAAQRRGQGLRVALVDVQDIYDEFNGGPVAPAAIRAFLAYAWSSWQPPAPSYVLLLGGGTFDPRGYCTAPGACPELVTAPNSTLIPPYLAAVNPWLGETAADNRFVALSPDSSLPWLAIGRLPAADAAAAGGHGGQDPGL